MGSYSITKQEKGNYESEQEQVTGYNQPRGQPAFPTTRLLHPLVKTNLECLSIKIRFRVELARGQEGGLGPVPTH